MKNKNFNKWNADPRERERLPEVSGLCRRATWRQRSEPFTRVRASVSWGSLKQSLSECEWSGSAPHQNWEGSVGGLVHGLWKAERRRR